MYRTSSHTTFFPHDCSFFCCFFSCFISPTSAAAAPTQPNQGCLARQLGRGIWTHSRIGRTVPIRGYGFPLSHIYTYTYAASILLFSFFFLVSSFFVGIDICPVVSLLVYARILSFLVLLPDLWVTSTTRWNTIITK